MDGGSRKQLSEVRTQVIILFKSENPTCGLRTDHIFSMITKHQFDSVVATWRQEGPKAVATRQKGSVPKKQILDEVPATVKDMIDKVRATPVKCSARIDVISVNEKLLDISIYRKYYQCLKFSKKVS